MNLGAKEIKELDERIDLTVPSLALLSRQREVALIHLLRTHESYMVGKVANPVRGERDNATTYGMDAMNHAVQWIFRFCPVGTPESTLAFDGRVYLQAEELHGAAREYSKVWDLMSLLHRGQLVGEKEDENTINLYYASEMNM